VPAPVTPPVGGWGPAGRPCCGGCAGRLHRGAPPPPAPPPPAAGPGTAPTHPAGGGSQHKRFPPEGVGGACADDLTCSLCCFTMASWQVAQRSVFLGQGSLQGAHALQCSCYARWWQAGPAGETTLARPCSAPTLLHVSAVHCTWSAPPTRLDVATPYSCSQPCRLPNICRLGRSGHNVHLQQLLSAPGRSIGHRTLLRLTM
jgi:hypothetical protein